MSEAELLEENNRLKEALAFYADPETYFAIGFFPDPPNGDLMDDFEELTGSLGHPDGRPWTKPGKRAREALRGEPISPRSERYRPFVEALAGMCFCGRGDGEEYRRGWTCTGCQARAALAGQNALRGPAGSRGEG